MFYDLTWASNGLLWLCVENSFRHKERDLIRRQVWEFRPEEVEAVPGRQQWCRENCSYSRYMFKGEKPWILMDGMWYLREKRQAKDDCRCFALATKRMREALWGSKMRDQQKLWNNAVTENKGAHTEKESLVNIHKSCIKTMGIIWAQKISPLIWRQQQKKQLFNDGGETV